MPDTQDRNIAATFAKGLRVLEAFDGRSAALTVADIARRTGQDRATARRGALTLVASGYLQQAGRAFALTPRVLKLAGGYLQANQFGRRVQPVLNHHAAAIGSEITLATRDGDAVLLLAQSTVLDGPVSQGFTPGSRLPLMHTSLGRMLLAGTTPENAERLIETAPMPRHTAQSLADRDAIGQRVHTIRQDGYAVTDSEFEPGIVGLAVPVSGPAETVIGTSSPRGRGDPANIDRLLRGLQHCAAELRQSMADSEI